MSLKEVKEIEKNKHRLTITVDRKTFDDAVNKVFRQQSKRITVPGFRRGKAPRAIIEKMYGSGVFHEDAVNEILPSAYEEASKESKLDIVGRPEFDIETIDENGVVITADVYVKPEVKIDGYKGIEVEKTPFTVEESEIDAEVERARERSARISDVTDRAAADGDIVKIDYTGYVDGKTFEGGADKDHSLTLGTHTFIEGFEEQIVGKNAGDEFDVNVTFPEDYHAKELAGKPAVFKVKLNEIKIKELPAADDEFATMVSEFDTIGEYRDDIKAKITDRKEKAADYEIENQLTEKLCDLIEADIPECMFDEETENCVRDWDNNLRMQGLNLNTYLKYTGMSLDSIREEMRPRAIKQVKTRLALEKIVALENIEVSDEEVDEEIKKMSEAYNVSVEEVKGLVPTDGVKLDIAVRKAMELVKAAAVVTEKKAEEPKKAKKETKEAKEAKEAKESDDAKTEEKPKAKKTTTRKPAAKKAESDAEGGDDASAKSEAKSEAKKPAAKKTAPKAKKENAEGENKENTETKENKTEE